MGRSPTARVVFAVLAIAFFLAPLVARGLGTTPEQFENRAFAEPPQLSQGWNAFQQATQYLVDRMPLRAQAVRANTQIWADVFNTDPRYEGPDTLADDDALPFAGDLEGDGIEVDVKEDAGIEGPVSASTGRDGWLYITEEFEYACKSPVPNDVLLDRWAGLVQALRDAGKSSAMFVVPMKASVYPEHLPEKYPFQHCALDEKERLWRLLSKAGPPAGVFELRSRLMALKRHAGDDLFELTDTHWTTLGAMTLVDALLEQVGGDVRLKSSEIVERGMIPYVGDLSVVSGRKETLEHMEYGIERDPDAPRVPGRTLLICDSFAYKWIRLFKPYFEDFRWVSFYHDIDEMTRAIRRSDTVVVEANEIFLRAQAIKKERAFQLAKALTEG
jgi:alginate O-acetyltransferase complex protein AlgJ